MDTAMVTTTTIMAGTAAAAEASKGA
jgi:hypothetical protein